MEVANNQSTKNFKVKQILYHANKCKYSIQ